MIPGVEDFFSKVKMYWGGEGDNSLEVNYTLKESEDSEVYVYNVNMKKVYLFADWTPGTVNYSWEVDKADDVEKYTNINFNNGVLKINGPIYAVKKDGKKELVNVADLTFTATATSADSEEVLAQQKDQKFNVTYPIDRDKIATPDEVEFYYSELKAGKTFNVTEGVSLTDIDGYTWIHKGEILNADKDGKKSVATAWVIENLKYEIVNVESAGQDLTAKNIFSIAPEGGELAINKPANITKPAEVTIKLTFDYKYEKGVYTTYTVIVDPTK